VVAFEVMNQMPYSEARKLVSHPVACIDCHDPATMRLRVTRPGFIEPQSRLREAINLEHYVKNLADVLYRRSSRRHCGGENLSRRQECAVRVY